MSLMRATWGMILLFLACQSVEVQQQKICQPLSPISNPYRSLGAYTPRIEYKINPNADFQERFQDDIHLRLRSLPDNLNRNYLSQVIASQVQKGIKVPNTGELIVSDTYYFQECFSRLSPFLIVQDKDPRQYKAAHDAVRKLVDIQQVDIIEHQTLPGTETKPYLLLGRMELVDECPLTYSCDDLNRFYTFHISQERLTDQPDTFIEECKKRLWQEIARIPNLHEAQRWNLTAELKKRVSFVKSDSQKVKISFPGEIRARQINFRMYEWTPQRKQWKRIMNYNGIIGHIRLHILIDKIVAETIAFLDQQKTDPEKKS
ncbi:MAG: hypothetical protein AAF206_00345 [Bacteroidota bacterium]